MTTDFCNWIKSSYSGNGGSCVEWAPEHASATGTVPLRDSKHTDGPVLMVSVPAFAGLVAGVKGGGFGTN
ncbi:DUF397 domain-containing protein [Streptomyces qinzhouensis]|uniref:DUF397 domain-containing protein n=1 Tax=Streptomyces qinzhouensis TaxID=2599401 RepID=A0A5B8JIR8_9ACTN|nr:DUF397 domain-containing protein [Streptomyces qinzhouensis]QDY77373.1 DUF397 domain-containing protein [Streptomyces qinzhouensis]